MSRINLQNDNNFDKENTEPVKKKRGGFFVADENTKEVAEIDETKTETPEKPEISASPAPELTFEQRRQKNKARLKKIVVCLSITLSVLLIIRYISNLDFVKDIGSGNKNDKHENPTKLYIYAPDWDTDIYTVEGYLDKKRIL